MESKFDSSATSVHAKKERNFPELKLNEQRHNFNAAKNQNGERNNVQPVLVIQSPKTPTLSRKLKAVSLDSDAGQKKNLDVARDVSSVPNTPKKQAKAKENLQHVYNDFTNNDFSQKQTTLAPHLGSNLKRFASNTSISGSQTLKTLPEIMTLQGFCGVKTEPIRIKAKGLLERRGSNASLTIDLGSNSNLTEQKPRPVVRLNTAKSVSNLNLTSFGYEKCACVHKCNNTVKSDETATVPVNKIVENAHKKINHSETCGNCTIYESIPSSSATNKKILYPRHQESCKCTLKFLPRYYIERHCVCNIKCRRKSLSNENLYVPPCNFCHFGSKDCHLASRACNRGSRKALYPRQTYIETSQLLSEDFKLHLQNVQYLQTAGSVLSVAELKSCCQMEKVPRLHQEFWEVPLNLQEKCLVSGSQSRNRYKGVLPNEHSRVHLPGVQSYIHANYIKGSDYTETAYIATQGPMSHTCEDFWNMVWNNKVYRIVMLTALVERGRSKCELYFPLGEDEDSRHSSNSENVSLNSGNITERSYYSQSSCEDEGCLMELEQKNIVQWGPYTISYISKEYLGDCVVRKLELVKSVIDSNDSSIEPAVQNDIRTILHYWYPNWADHKLANPEQVLQIALHVMGIESSKSNSATDSLGSADAILNSSSSSDQEIACGIGGGNKFDFDLSAVQTQNLPCGFNIGVKKGTSLDFSHDNNLKMTFSFTDKNAMPMQTQSADNKVFAFDAKTNKTVVSSKFSFEPDVTATKSESTEHCLTNPIVVHCSAGIGRTGCFLAILNGIQQLRSNYNVDILAIVCSLRLNRGGMVQTAEQYELIHRVLSLYADFM